MNHHSLDPGEETRYAPKDEELFYVLKNNCEAIREVGGETFHADLKPGAAFHKTSCIYHNMRNTGNEHLVRINHKV